MRRLPVGWPLVVLYLGFPIWWLLGFGVLGFFLATVPMMAYLWGRRGTLVVPGGFMLWVLFLVVVLLSALQLTADAPGAVPGGSVTSRLITFGFRLAWYISGTVALLYVMNIPERTFPFERVAKLLAFMFIVTVMGGLLGLAIPELEFVGLLFTPFQRIIASVPFAYNMIKVDVADVANVLGYAETRPKAPFAYANAWGANLSLFLPFFLFTWLVRATAIRSLFSIMVLLAAVVGAVYSLNRTLWLAVVLGLVYSLMQVVRVRPRAILPVLVGVLVAVTMFLASGLGGVVQSRLDNPHSNERRSELAGLTATSVWQGSPIVGFGTTRDVQGSFASIAGGDTPDCRACDVPPLGTQGHFWLLLFATGIVGTSLFSGFLVYRLSRHLPSRDVPTMFAIPVALFFLLESPFYDLLGPPLFTLMIAFGLMWRRASGGVTEAQHEEVR